MTSTTQAIPLADLDERMRLAVNEVQRTIADRFPATTFVLTRSPEDPSSIHLLAVADIDDPDDVGDLVVDRVVALQVEEGIPLHVIPLRAPARVQAAMDQDQRGSAPQRLWALRLLKEPV